MTSATNPVALQGSETEDLELISKAKEDIKEILINHLGSASYEVAEYILKNFFAGDATRFSEKKVITKHKSFLKLISEISGETGKSKSWIYDAMNLWLEREELKDSEAYMKISISHRTLLLRVNSVNDKRKLAEKFYSEKLSFKEAKKLIEPPSSRDTPYSNALRLAVHPERFESTEYRKKIDEGKLKILFEELKEEQRKEVSKKADNRIRDISDQIESYRERLATLKTFKKNWDSLLG